MAQYIIVFTSEADARTWMQEMDGLNQETQQSLTEVSRTLQDVGTVSSGDMVTQMVNAGTQLCSGISDVFDSMGGVVNAVGGMLDSAANLVDTVADAVVKLGGIFGL